MFMRIEIQSNYDSGNCIGAGMVELKNSISFGLSKALFIAIHTAQKLKNEKYKR